MTVLRPHAELTLQGWGEYGAELSELVTGLGPVLLGVVVYLGVAWWARIPEAEAVIGLVRRRVSARGRA